MEFPLIRENPKLLLKAATRSIKFRENFNGFFDRPNSNLNASKNKKKNSFNSAIANEGYCRRYIQTVHAKLDNEKLAFSRNLSRIKA